MERRTFLQTLAITSGTIIVGGHSSFGHVQDDSAFRILMVYNNIGTEASLTKSWGLSILIENASEALLFDAGGEPDVLMKNLDTLGVDIGRISRIVISHNHGDHIGGLSGILDKMGVNPQIFVPHYELEDIQSSTKTTGFIGVDQPREITRFAWSTGQLVNKSPGNSIYEQAIIVINNDDIYVFTGCSHPGIVQIVEKARSLFPGKTIKLVAGGFHLIDHTDLQVLDISYKLRNLGVEKLAPSHCTGESAIRIFQDDWGDDFINFDLSANQFLI